MKSYENQTFTCKNFDNVSFSDDTSSECKFEISSFQKSNLKNSNFLILFM